MIFLIFISRKLQLSSIEYYSNDQSPNQLQSRGVSPCIVTHLRALLRFLHARAIYFLFSVYFSLLFYTPPFINIRYIYNNHGLSLITSPSKMTTVLIRRNAPTDSCHNLTALMPRCKKTSFLLTPHYICAHRNSDNLHNAVFIGYPLVARVMADEHLIVVLHQIRAWH